MRKRRRQLHLKNNPGKTGKGTVFLKICREFNWIAEVFERAGWTVYRGQSNSHAPLGLELYFMWAGSKYSHTETVRNLKKNGGKIIYAEHGWLPQQASFYLDAIGTGVSSSLMNMKLEGTLTDQEKTLLRGLIVRYKSLMVSSDIKIRYDDKSDKDLVVLVPLQKDGDDQIIRSSPFKNMKAFLISLASIKGVNFLIKMHPREPKHLKLVSEFGGRLNFTFLPAKCDLGSLLDTVDHILTINSTTGIEGLAWGKGVSTFGKSIYTRPELVNQLNSKHIILKEDLISDKQDQDLVDVFLYNLFKRQLTKGDVDHPDFIERILDNNFMKAGM